MGGSYKQGSDRLGLKLNEKYMKIFFFEFSEPRNHFRIFIYVRRLYFRILMFENLEKMDIIQVLKFKQETSGIALLVLKCFSTSDFENAA